MNSICTGGNKYSSLHCCLGYRKRRLSTKRATLAHGISGSQGTGFRVYIGRENTYNELTRHRLWDGGWGLGGWKNCRQRALSFFFFFCVWIFNLSLAGRNSGCLTWVRLQQPQEQRYPFLTVHEVFSFVHTAVWLPVLGIFNVRTDVSACDCTRWLRGHRKSLSCVCFL